MKLAIKLFGPEARAAGSGELVVDVAALPIGCDALRPEADGHVLAPALKVFLKKAYQ